MTVWNEMNFTTVMENVNEYVSKSEKGEFKITHCSLPDYNGVTDYAQITSTDHKYTIHLYGFDDAYSAKIFYKYDTPKVKSNGNYSTSQSVFLNTSKSTIKTEDEFVYVYVENNVGVSIKTDIENQYEIIKIMETVGLS
jgi:hypothetical protein